jgi:hypothetical protein
MSNAATTIAADYLAHQVWVAECRMSQARGDLANATTKRAKRDANEDIDFWGNKLAHYASVAKQEAKS